MRQHYVDVVQQTKIFSTEISQVPLSGVLVLLKAAKYVSMCVRVCIYIYIYILHIMHECDLLKTARCVHVFFMIHMDAHECEMAFSTAVREHTLYYIFVFLINASSWTGAFSAVYPRKCRRRADAGHLFRSAGVLTVLDVDVTPTVAIKKAGLGTMGGHASSVFFVYTLIMSFITCSWCNLAQLS